MVTPFKAPGNNARKIKFNRDISATRSVVECAIGVWKERFRPLVTGIPFSDMTRAAECIQALGGLHNFIIEHDAFALHEFRNDVIVGTMDLDSDPIEPRPNHKPATNQIILDRFY